MSALNRAGPREREAQCETLLQKGPPLHPSCERHPYRVSFSVGAAGVGEDCMEGCVQTSFREGLGSPHGYHLVVVWWQREYSI